MSAKDNKLHGSYTLLNYYSLKPEHGGSKAPDDVCKRKREKLSKNIKELEK